MSLLEVQNLVVEFPNRRGTLRALDDMSFSIAPGEVLGVVGESGAGKSLTGRRLTLTGFITTAPDGSPMLARMVLACCAADGRPIKIGLDGRAPIDVPADTWVQLTGVHSARTTKDPVNDVDVAFFDVQTWQEVPQPKQPYA